jgi:hypothetical protein
MNDRRSRYFSKERERETKKNKVIEGQFEFDLFG